MNIFQEIKTFVSAGKAAEQYGIKINRNKMACCPFHDDRHPSMKIDQNYFCFACGAKGDVIDFTARLFGISQFDAARKLIGDFDFQSNWKSTRTLKRSSETGSLQWYKVGIIFR